VAALEGYDLFSDTCGEFALLVGGTDGLRATISLGGTAKQKVVSDQFVGHILAYCDVKHDLSDPRHHNGTSFKV